MNNRIKELAAQAGYHLDIYEIVKCGLEPFAELIIKECIDSIKYWRDATDAQRRTLERVSQWMQRRHY